MKVSIIMPTYNDAKNISSSIKSVINQTHTNWELLIMDDGSIDNTCNIVKSFTDPRIQYYKQENKGQLVALNNLCSYITGDIVLMLHSDDSLYSSDTIEVNLKHFSDPHIDGLFGDLHQFFDSGKPDEIIKAPTTIDKKSVYRLLILLGSNIIFDHFFVRRVVFENNVRNNYFKYYMPYWLKFENDAVTSLNLKYTDYPWYHYRVYDQNYTNSIIGNFEVYFTRFRTIHFLSNFYSVPFPVLQKELLRRYNIYTPIVHKKASNKNIAKSFEANIRSMRRRTPGAKTNYFDLLVKFYNTNDKRSIILHNPIELNYKPSEARRFFNDILNNTLPPLTREIINELETGFTSIIVKNQQEKLILIELLNFLCLRVEIEIM